MKIKGITLLSREEYEKHEEVIPLLQCKWWLRNASVEFDDSVDAIDYGDLEAYDPNVSWIGIRPLCVFEVESSDKLDTLNSESLVGKKFEYNNRKWTILEAKSNELWALCDKIIAKAQFDGKSNIYDNSSIKRWLETEGIAEISAPAEKEKYYYQFADEDIGHDGEVIMVAESNYFNDNHCLDDEMDGLDELEDLGFTCLCESYFGCLEGRSRDEIRTLLNNYEGDICFCEKRIAY